MRAFLDFEASSLGKVGYPIEVAWVFEDGRSEAHLIRPAPNWTDWDAESEAVHGIDRARLVADGTPHDVVARRMVEVLTGHDIYASAPSWDGKWLSALLRAAGLPRHALRLKDTEEAQRTLAARILEEWLDGPKLEAAIATVLAEVRQIADQQPPRHRALDDAERERQSWFEVGRLAFARVEGMRPMRQA